MRRGPFVLLGLLAACSADAAPEREPPVGVSAAAVVGGVASTAAQDAVVLVVGYDDQGAESYTCSGTLVAENLVLTARHCVSAFESGADFECAQDGTLVAGPHFTVDIPAAQLAIYTGVKARMSEYERSKPEAVARQVIHAPGDVLCNADLAFLVLDRRLAEPVAPLRRTVPTVGEDLTVVGFGLVGNSGLSFVRQQRAQTVTAVGPLLLDPQTKNGLGSSEFLVGEGVCSGDSGGPLLSANGEVVGVVSRGGGGMQNVNEVAADCLGATAINVLSHLAHASALVDEAFAAAAAAPSAPPPPASTVANAPPPTPAGTPAHGDGGSGGCALAPPRPTRGTFAVVAFAAALLARRRRR